MGRITLDKSKNAILSSVNTAPRAFSTLLIGIAAFVLMTLSSFPGYSIQFIGAGIENLPAAVLALARNSYSTGPLNLSLTFVYAALIGIATTNIGIQLRSRQFSGETAASMGPGFLAAGCAGCGAGLLGFLGFAGALSALPFNGIEIRLGGILLLLFFILDAGDPEACEV